MSFEFQPLATADGDDLYRLLSECFGGNEEQVKAWRWFGDELLGRENLRTLRRSGELIGGLAYYRFGQWWGGRSVPLAGIAGVGVRPEDRRTGAARAVMTAALEELRQEGTPLSALFASTSRLYRALGYERSGSFCRYSVPIAKIGVVDRELSARRVDSKDPVFRELYRVRAQAAAGNLDRSDAIWRRIFRPDRGTPRAFVVGPPEAPRGYVIYSQGDSKGEKLFDVTVRDLVALDAAAARRIWALIADHGTLAGDATWFGPPVDPLLMHLPEQDYAVARHEAWLLRVVDVAAALEARGYPADVEGELHLEVSDALLPANAGRYLLRVEGGLGRVERGGEGRLVLDVRGLAALYAGFHSPLELFRLGLLEAPPAEIQRAGRCFAGPAPWLPDHF